MIKTLENKLGKACGADSLTAEHLINAQPLLLIHLSAMFRFVMKHSLVPDEFDKGVVVPLIKDKFGCINSPNNYRGITLIHVLAKRIGLVNLEICNNFSVIDNLQFGFKPSVGCNNASRYSVDKFKDKGSTIYEASLLL